MATGLVTLINSSALPVSYYKHYLSGSAIDNDSDIFYYPAVGGYVYGIDIHNGSLVYSHNYGSNTEFLFMESASDYLCEVAGIENIKNESRLLVYPNPTSNNIHFTRIPDDNFPLELSILSINGTLLLEQTVITNNQSISLYGIASGMYIYTLHSEKYFQYGKIVKTDSKD